MVIRKSRREGEDQSVLFDLSSLNKPKESGERIKLKGKPIIPIFDKFSRLKNRRPNDLTRDFRKFEDGPSQREKDKKDVDEGRKFSSGEMSHWQKSVGFQIARTVKQTGHPIEPGSAEEKLARVTVWEFRKNLSKERDRRLASHGVFGKWLAIDLNRKVFK